MLAGGQKFTNLFVQRDSFINKFAKLSENQLFVIAVITTINERGSLSVRICWMVACLLEGLSTSGDTEARPMIVAISTVPILPTARLRLGVGLSDDHQLVTFAIRAHSDSATTV